MKPIVIRKAIDKWMKANGVVIPSDKVEDIISNSNFKINPTPGNPFTVVTEDAEFEIIEPKQLPPNEA